MPTETSERGIGDRLRAARTRARSTRGGALAWRIVVTVVGVAVVLGGVLLLPLPGPGWLIIFAGLGILATEYVWASRLLRYARRKVASWTDWVAVQSRPIQALLALVGLIVLGAVFAAVWWYYAGR